MKNFKHNQRVNGVRSFAATSTTNEWYATPAVVKYNKETNVELLALHAAQTATEAKQAKLTTDLANTWQALKAKGVVA